MNKKAMFAIVAIVAIGIMLSAAAVGAWAPVKPEKLVPPAPPVDASPASPAVLALAAELVQAATDNGYEADEQALIMMLTSVEASGVGLGNAEVVTGDDAGATAWFPVAPFIPNGGIHILPTWLFVPPDVAPGGTLRAAIIWDNAGTDLDMHLTFPFIPPFTIAHAIGDGEGTLTEEVCIPNYFFGWGLVIVHNQGPVGQFYIATCDVNPYN